MPDSSFALQAINGLNIRYFEFHSYIIDYIYGYVKLFYHKNEKFTQNKNKFTIYFNKSNSFT
jgi:hypothetical protein